MIFNPAARGNKARNFRRYLDEMSGRAAFKATAAPGDARRLAAEAVADGFDTIAAAGGDGTVNEVLNGIGDANGFRRTRFGVLPLGTVNVFARDLKIPLKLEYAWEVLRRGRERILDLPQVEFSQNGRAKKQFFIQLAGAGLDARAIELVSWQHKKRIGPLAYVVAGLKASREKKPLIHAVENSDGANSSFNGELILIGNGKLYGGEFQIFPQADFNDGLLDVCIIPRADFATLLRCGPGLLLRLRLPEGTVKRFRAASFELSGEANAAFQLDGEGIGKLPAKFSIAAEKLRVIA
ncbi:MAG TPA: diacylglycerol kinase family protein [Candidatus Acidoferrales bacterium]|nr:diacylglycerol kinase family protein [Candidatus Acidoferrales bacterium]